MQYAEILTHAGRLIWKFKILWFFGLLVSCSSGAGPRFTNSFSFNAADFSASDGVLSEPLRSLVLGFGQRIEENVGQFVALALLIICGLGIAGWLIGTYGRTGVALGAWVGDAGAQQLELEVLSNAAQQAFWRVAGVTLLVGFPGFAVGLIFILAWVFGAAAMYSQAVTALGSVFLCLSVPLICLLLPLFWGLGILSELATVAVVGEGLGVLDGVQRGWEMFTRHLGPLLLMGLLVLILQMIAGIGVGLLLTPLSLGTLGLGLLAGLLGQPVQWSMGLLLLLGLVLLPISLAAGAVVNAYIGTLWTMVFRRLAAAELPSPAASGAPVN